jgi:FSR family fosmidomycin resistance protein-like MFS transporter
MRSCFSKYFLVKSFALLWMAHFLLDFFVGIWPIYKTMIGIDIAVAGLIVGISGFIGELSQGLFGYFSDRGHRKAILMLGIVLGSAILWITAANSFFYWFLFVFLLMLGSASFHPSGTGMASYLSARQKGKGVLFFASGGAFGLAFSQLLFTKVMRVTDGRPYMLYVPFLLIFLLLLFHPFPKDVAESNKKKHWRDVFIPLRENRKSLSLLYLAQVANQALFVSLLFLLPDILKEKGCQTWLCFGGGHMSVVLGGAFSMFLAGYLCDKYGHKIVLILAFTFASVMLYLFLVRTNLSLTGSIVSLVAIGAFLNVCNPVIISWGNHLVPEYPSSVSALLMGFAWALGNLAPIGAGLVSQLFATNTYAYTIAIMGTSLIIGLMIVFFIPRPRKDLSEEPVLEMASSFEDVD